MIKHYRDTRSNEILTVYDISYKYYRYVSKEVFPSVYDFIKSVSVENGGTLQELTEAEAREYYNSMISYHTKAVQLAVDLVKNASRKG